MIHHRDNRDMARPPRPTRRRAALAASALLAAALLAACGGTSATTAGAPTASTTSAAPPAGNPTSAGSAAGGVILPVTSNPIVNTATAATLRIAKVLVENNVDPATGKVANDHLEVELANSGTTDLAGVELYYTFHDPTSGATEHYYAPLPAAFTVPAGGSRTAHFDAAPGTDHFPVNTFSLYYTDKNALEVTVVAGAAGAAVQTTTLNKDAGGAETAD